MNSQLFLISFELFAMFFFDKKNNNLQMLEEEGQIFAFRLIILPHSICKTQHRHRALR